MDVFAMNSAVLRARHRVVGLLMLLFAVTYLDRVCISVAGPRMQADLHIDPVGWGWVTAMFTLSYCLFELPTGFMGDRIGPRVTLTRIVSWWSAFTILTGAVTGYTALLAVRFLFGAGEAGAFPNASIVVARWFPPSQRATLCGVNLMASQIGGALAPLLVVPIQMRWGWRVSFFFLGALGIVWAAAWYGWFRDSPAEKLGSVTGDGPQPDFSHADHALPMRVLVRSSDVASLLVIGFCYWYSGTFFSTWFHTYLVKGRGFPETGLWLSALPFTIAAGANFFGGTLSDALVRRLGRTNGRRSIGLVAAIVVAISMIAATTTRQPIVSIGLLCVAYGAIALQQSVAFGACLDLGHRRAGATTGLFNTFCNLGGLAGSLAFGYIVSGFGSFDAPFYPMAAISCVGALAWWRLDASRELVAAPPAAPLTASI
jgi:MFS family permease